jgi:hypothetical protein
LLRSRPPAQRGTHTAQCRAELCAPQPPPARHLPPHTRRHLPPHTPTTPTPPLAPGLVLERNELIALVNLLHKLAGAVETVRTLSLQLAEGGAGAQAGEGLGAIEQVVHSGGLPGVLRS